MQKRVVVTGASSGIGEATARRFAALGWEVLAVARRADRLAALAAEAPGVRPIEADVTRDEDVARVRAALGGAPLHALVNNAGGALGLASVETGDLEDWRTMYEVNVLGTKRMVAALLPALRDGARELGVADVVVITSVAATNPYEGGAGYNAAKAAQHMLAAVLRLEVAEEGIRVIEIAPGMVRTDFSLVRFKGDRERADAVYAGVENPLVADDIAEAVTHAVGLPPHVDVESLTVRPVAQASQSKVIRGPLAPKP